MWKIHRTTVLAATLLALLSGPVGPVVAQETNINNQNTNAFQLPGVTLPSGHDEVRAADGTTCRSAVSGRGAYVDIGVIGNPSGETTQSAYGRVVIPLGRSRTRLDCSQLYALEVERLRAELRLMKMGVGAGNTLEMRSTVADEFTDDGWTQAGRE